MILKNGQEIVIRKAIIDYCNMIGGENGNLLFGKNEFGMTLEQEKVFY
ncbi:MAG: hypothetical protein FWE07_07355 [Turicibacter sp.]|nr:hypothetical protein [Turicibacter sp.]